MKPAKLDRRIVIQQRSDGTPDAYGKATPTWTNYATLWSEDVTTKASTRSLYENDIESGKVDKVFVVRWRSDLTHEMAVLYEDVRYRLAPPLEWLGRRDSLMLFCSRMTTDT
jgi:SPP1 family predicted phage head-tail adaptor